MQCDFFVLFTLFVLSNRDLESVLMDETLNELDRSEKIHKIKDRNLGNIRFIGELYLREMLTQKIMHHCIVNLLKYENPDQQQDLGLQP